MDSESARVSSGFPGCSRDEGTAMNSAFNSISAVILVVVRFQLLKFFLKSENTYGISTYVVCM